ncbi:MAG: ribokinase [Planctomycetota bacterium]
MPLLNVGSLNLDLVYRLPSIVAPGQTLPSHDRQLFCGGKGANQSIAAARAGATVLHAGNLGHDGQPLLNALHTEAIDTTLITTHPDAPSGHAIIQVDDAGENAILLFPGTNHRLTPDQITAALDTLDPDTPDHFVLTQNETNRVDELLAAAHDRRLRTAFNPAPMTPDVQHFPLEGVALLIVNETEALALADTPDPERALDRLHARTGGAVVLTLGSQGSLYRDANHPKLHTPAQPVTPVDTTAAGDTFIGFLLARFLAGDPPLHALHTATTAAALAVTRPGAIPSIPRLDELPA